MRRGHRAGRNHDGNKTFYDYNGRAQVVHTWGDVPFPTEAGYDSYGQQTSLKTYRGGSGWNSSTWESVTTGADDETVWAYHDATDVNGDGVLNASDDALFLALLSGGNSAMYVVYTWDAGNRLTKVEPGGTPQNGQYKAEYKYDWQGRRIEKQVWSFTSGGGGSWTPTEHWKFMYADWLLLLELDGLDTDSIKRQYSWGLDLSGVASGGPAGRLTDGAIPTVLTAAGGIAGLLSVHDSAGPVDYVYFADVQGNIGQVVDLAAASASASMMAKYDYDAYGNRTLNGGAYTQPFAFSTKPYDAESGFAYFGQRYYSAVLGRWISRPPVPGSTGESYAYVPNAPTWRSGN